jgi:hypothetical protein
MRAARIVFAALVVATIGAFFLAQRVKSTPATLARFSVLPVCSPNQDSRLDGCRAAFLLRKAEDVSVSVIDADGEEVAEVLSDMPVGRYKGVRVLWRGETDEGGRAPHGRYRFRLTLRRQGRSIVLPKSFVIDTTPPTTIVTRIEPELLPAREGTGAEIHVDTLRSRFPTSVKVYRTDPGASPVPIADLGMLNGPGTVTWDGKRDGRYVRAGTYVVALETRDAAGNFARLPEELPPEAGYGEGLPGRGGISVRYLAVQAPLGAPAVGGEPVEFYVDARGRPYTWALRRAGENRPRKSSRATRSKLRMQTPDGESGLFILEAATRRHSTQVPLAVQGLKRREVLVVLPAIGWQGLNRVDDDSDGLVDTLDQGRPVRRDRVLANGLPSDLVTRVAPLLIFLDRQRYRYDLTTDLALATGNGPPVEGHKGIIVAGDERWLPTATQRALNAYVRDGGRVATFGIESLRRSVRVTPTELSDPTTEADTDALGFTMGALVRRRATATIETDRIDLFKGDVLGGTGVFAGYTVLEPVDAEPPGSRVVSRAVTPRGEAPIVAAEVENGLAIRIGLPELTSRLSRGGNEAALVKRVWELLSE